MKSEWVVAWLVERASECERASERAIKHIHFRSVRLSEFVRAGRECVSERATERASIFTSAVSE